MTRFTSMLLRIASGICTADDRAAILEPLVADWQREYAEARRQSRVRAASVVIRGTLAFALTMLICANPFRGADGVPARRFAISILAFAAAATLIQSAPFQPLPLRWWVFRVDIYYAFPRFFALGLALALLPAAILAADRVFRARFIIVVFLALVTAFVASNIVAPASERLQYEQHIRSSFPADHAELILRRFAGHPRVRPIDATGALARSEYLARHRDIAFGVLAIALGVLGAAIGRSRRAAGARPRVAVAAAWWFFVWMAYQLLQFWALRLKVVLPAPTEVAIWIPPLAFLAIAIAASLRTKGGAEAPPLQA